MGLKDTTLENKMEGEINNFYRILCNLFKTRFPELDLDEEAILFLGNPDNLTVFCLVKNSSDVKPGGIIGVVYKNGEEIKKIPLPESCSLKPAPVIDNVEKVSPSEQWGFNSKDNDDHSTEGGIPFGRAVASAMGNASSMLMAGTEPCPPPDAIESNVSPFRSIVRYIDKDGIPRVCVRI